MSDNDSSNSDGDDKSHQNAGLLSDCRFYRPNKCEFQITFRYLFFKFKTG